MKPKAFDFDEAWDRLRAALPQHYFKMERIEAPDALIIRVCERGGVTGNYHLGAVKVSGYLRKYGGSELTTGINVAASSGATPQLEHPLFRQALAAAWEELDRQQAEVVAEKGTK